MKIKVDVFPAHLQVAPAGVINDVQDLKPQPARDDLFYVGTSRVIITSENDLEKIVVASDSPAGPQIIFMEEIVEGHKSDDSIYRVVTKSGKMLAFEKDTNCGCGSRLRGWNPYKTLSSSRD